MTRKQEAFVTGHLEDFNATRAEIRAGYSPKTARATGPENLKKPEIQGALLAVFGARRAQAIMTYEDAYILLTKIARATVSDLLGEEGLVDVKLIRALNSPAVLSVKQYTDADVRTVTRLGLRDVIRAIERLAKLHGWDAAEKHEVKTTITIKEPSGWGG